MLRPARSESAVRSGRDSTGQLDRGVQYARRKRRTGQAGIPANRFCRDSSASHVSIRVRRRAVPSDFRRGPAAVRAPVEIRPRARGGTRGPAGHSSGSPALGRILRSRIFLPQVRPGADPGLRVRRHGARRRDVPARGVRSVPFGSYSRRQDPARRASAARDRPPVVRGPGDHAVVRRPLAKGGLRAVHGVRDARHALSARRDLEALLYISRTSRPPMPSMPRKAPRRFIRRSRT